MRIEVSDKKAFMKLIETGVYINSYHCKFKPKFCYKCCAKNHMIDKCKSNKIICYKCSGNHAHEVCTTNNPLCFACKGCHYADSAECERYLNEHIRINKKYNDIIDEMIKSNSKLNLKRIRISQRDTKIEKTSNLMNNTM